MERLVLISLLFLSYASPVIAMYADTPRVPSLIPITNSAQLIFRAERNALQHKMTPLIFAAWQGSMPMVMALLAREDLDLDAAMDDGTTALHLAAYWGHVDVVAVLAGMGANVNVHTMDGKTPLAMAEEQKHEAVATILRTFGACE